MPNSYLPPLNDLAKRNRTEKMEIGDCGEEHCIKHIKCISCNKQNWINLNDTRRNMIGVDLQCRNCGEYAQVKTFKEFSDGVSPIKQTTKGDAWWDDMKIPSFTTTLRKTLEKYNNNIRYYCIIYKNTQNGRLLKYTAITERLSIANMCGEKTIRSKNTKWIFYK